MGKAAHTTPRPRTRKRGRPTASASASAASFSASASTSTSASTASASGGGWAELPEGLLLLVLDRLPSIVDLLAFAGVCASWRALAAPSASASIGGGRPPLLLAPVIDPLISDKDLRAVIFGRRQYRPRRCHLLSPAAPAASYRCLVPPSILALPFLGYSHGHLIFCRGRDPLLANVVTGELLRPPELPRDCRLLRGILTAPLSDPDSSLLLWNIDSVLLRWRVDETGYSEHTVGAGAGEGTQCRMTHFRGKIFIWHLRPGQRSLFRVEFSPHFSVTELVFQRTWEPSRLCSQGLSPFTEQLVECGGDLMLVHCANAAAGSSFSFKVEVLRLDLSDPPSWIKVENLGETALFVDFDHGSSVSCPNPSTWGGRSNCIYVARRHNAMVLPLDGGAIDVDGPNRRLLSWATENYPIPPLPPIWVYPSMLY